MNGRQTTAFGLCAIVFLFLPGFISIIFEDDDSNKSSKDSVRQWIWNFQDISQSFLEVPCSLPYSECEWRPYHRRFLSYALMNLICCLFCTALFLPAYLKGYIRPLPSVNFNSMIRIGPFDLL